MLPQAPSNDTPEHFPYNRKPKGFLPNVTSDVPPQRKTVTAAGFTAINCDFLSCQVAPVALQH